MYLAYIKTNFSTETKSLQSCRENKALFCHTKVKFILHSDGNKMNIDGKQFIVLKVH